MHAICDRGETEIIQKMKKRQKHNRKSSEVHFPSLEQTTLLSPEQKYNNKNRQKRKKERIWTKKRSRHHLSICNSSFLSLVIFTIVRRKIKLREVEKGQSEESKVLWGKTHFFLTSHLQDCDSNQTDLKQLRNVNYHIQAQYLHCLS